ncbi:endoribonuclease L-PSP [Pseudonocardia hierapolitana]|uniref:Endoribonuclease L-PSP n=1 Tax=Pseudonocardia hierapolitana TaxID=1128676 RepID=A0A561STW1_9PSEU|nr:RidA family protein [Pseudonocardia hierapolitana]TWF78300.1 endoribonuclease L-PSP [Pseudonocardia hierapolitana]
MIEPLQRLHDAGLHLPEAPPPLGSYVPAIRAGGLLYLSGMLPLRQGAPGVTGRVGEDLDPDQGRSAAAMAALNALAVVHAAVGLAAVSGVVRLAVHIACPPGFQRHAEVADGASQVFDIAFTPARHSRLAFGSTALPAGMPVELDVIAALR